MWGSTVLKYCRTLCRCAIHSTVERGVKGSWVFKGQRGVEGQFWKKVFYILKLITY